MYQTHSQTSKDAYCQLSDEQKQIDMVYNEIILSKNNGLTGSEIADILSLPIGTVSARLTTLIRQKKVKRSNITRRVNGRFSTVCFAMETTMGQLSKEANQKRDRLKGLVKELLLNKNESGGLNLSAVDVKRLEAMTK
jgi:predicted transcriptional regulator